MSVCSDPDCPHGCASICTGQPGCPLHHHGNDGSVYQRAPRAGIGAAMQAAMLMAATAPLEAARAPLMAPSTPTRPYGPLRPAVSPHGGKAKRARNKAERKNKQRGRRGR